MWTRVLSLLFLFFSAVAAFQRAGRGRYVTAQAATITKGVDFNTIAREWRLKWSADDDKKSLAAVQQTLVLMQNQIKSVAGVKSVQRIVCGGCLDYKVIVALDAAKFGEWEAKKFAPEEEFIKAVKAIAGVSTVETQTYTIENV
jgi:hypothetical protein